MSEVVSRQELPVNREDDIIVVRRRVRDVAEQRRFDTFAAAAVTTATSELARNIVVHAFRGIAVIEEVTEGARVGIRVTFTDEGPGIPDIPRVLAGGHSTSRTMGLGLSGSKRLVDVFTIESTPGKGTSITILKWKRF